MSTPRDIFISELFEFAKIDPKVIFISVDLGAPALDIWRKELPDQFIAGGISEQNAINVAAGLARAGMKPYVYFMASFVARCFEQIRYSCAMAQNPITILGNGVGLGYAPAGPAHEPTEDLCYMRAIPNIEIVSPSSESLTKYLVKDSLDLPKLRWIRLERNLKESTMLSRHAGNSLTKSGIDLYSECGEPQSSQQILILTSGYMLHRAEELSLLISKSLGVKVKVYDLWRIKPIDLGTIRSEIENAKFLITIEEQALEGGFGSAIIEELSIRRISIEVLRFGLKKAFIFENGTRDQLLNENGLNVEYLHQEVVRFSNN